MTDHLMDRHPVGSRLSAKVHCYFHASVKDNCLSYGLDQMHQSNHRQEALLNKMSPAMETTEAKRPASNYMDEKVQKGTPPKKSKLELRPSCAPLKVRKEKLGDRISTLQQMVAPFGKVPHVNRTDYQLIDISEDGFVSLLTETGGTKDDLKLPTDDTLLSQIKKAERKRK